MLYWTVPVPPVDESVIDPSEPLKQLTLVLFGGLNEGPAEELTKTVVETVHPFATFTVKLYDPAFKFENVPLETNEPVFNLYWSGDTPPVALHVKAPFACPHVAFVVAIVLKAIPEGCVIVKVVEAVHPFKSLLFKV